jgi:hypothetical protein
MDSSFFLRHLYIIQNFLSHYFQYIFPSINFMFVLPQIPCGNMALIFPSHFHGYNKNEIICRLLGCIECF